MTSARRLFFIKMMSKKGLFLPLLKVYIFYLEKHGINKPGASILNINRQYYINLCVILRLFFCHRVKKITFAKIFSGLSQLNFNETKRYLISIK